MKKILKMVTVILATLVPGAFAAPPANAPLTLKLGTLAPKNSTFDLIIRDMGDKWKAAGVNLSVFSGTIGDEPDMVAKMSLGKMGQIQVGVFTVVGLAQIDKGVQALSIPLLYRDSAENDYVRQKMQPILEQRLLAKGFKVLNWGEAGWVYFFGKQPVLIPDDLKKMKFFVWGNDSDSMGIWKSAGFSPVPLSVTDILPNLQTGLINCFDTTPISALSFQWFTSAPHMTNMKYAPLIGATIINTKAWERIPLAARPAILKAAQEAGVRFRDDIRSNENGAIKKMQEIALKVHDITDEQHQQWETLFQGIYPQISGKIVPADMMQMAIKYRDEYRSKKPGKKAAK